MIEYINFLGSFEAGSDFDDDGKNVHMVPIYFFNVAIK